MPYMFIVYARFICRAYVKTKQGYPQSNVHSVLDRFVVHTHMQSSFQMYSNVVCRSKESKSSYIFILNLWIYIVSTYCPSSSSDAYRFKYYGIYPVSIRLLLSYHTSFNCFSIPFSSFDTMCNTRRRRVYVVIYQCIITPKLLISKL